MSRVLKVMVILMTLSFVGAIAVQPALAGASDIPVAGEDDSVGGGEGSDVMDMCGDPSDNGEGDPDTVGGGYGAHPGENGPGGLLEGLLGVGGDSGLTFEEFIYLLMLEFMINP